MLNPLGLQKNANISNKNSNLVTFGFDQSAEVSETSGMEIRYAMVWFCNGHNIKNTANV